MILYVIGSVVIPDNNQRHYKRYRAEAIWMLSRYFRDIYLLLKLSKVSASLYGSLGDSHRIIHDES